MDNLILDVMRHLKVKGQHLIWRTHFCIAINGEIN